MKTILIFGATGAIGAYTTIELSKEYNVIAVGRRKSDNDFFKDYGIEYHSIDITQKAEFDKLPKKGIDAIVHVAGVLPARMEGYNPRLYIDTDLHGTLNILEYMAKTKIEKIIYVSNSNNSLYNLGKIPVPPDIQKTFPKNNDHSIFAICKNAAIDLIEHYHHKHGFNRFILRLYKMYLYHPNPYFYVDGKKRMMPYRLFIEQAMQGRDIELWGNPSIANETIYIYDCVSVIQRALESPLPGGVYNVGGITPISLEDRVRGIIEVFSPSNKKSNIIYYPEKPGIPEYAADISKTRHELGYAPQWTYVKAFNDIKEKMHNNYFSKLWGTCEDYIAKDTDGGAI